MIAWNAIARLINADGVPAAQQAGRLASLAYGAGSAEAGDVLAEGDAPGAAGYREGRYWLAIDRSEDLLLADCRSVEREADQRRSVQAFCEAVRDAYELGYRDQAGKIPASGPAASQ
jgi:hypothetical protein